MGAIADSLWVDSLVLVEVVVEVDPMGELEEEHTEGWDVRGGEGKVKVLVLVLVLVAESDPHGDAGLELEQ